jgi:flagellar biosynthesis protein FlhG
MSGSAFNTELGISGSSGSRLTRTLTITSGKGGVGKTTLVSNLAITLAQQDKKVLILDGDLGMANVDIMFGKQVHKNIMSVLNGEAPLMESIAELHPNIYLLSGGSGIKELQKINDYQRQLLLDQVANLPIHFDYLLIDTAPGIDDNVLYLNSCAHERNIIVTPDPASLTDSYALIKVLHKTYKLNRFSIIANFVRDESEGLALYKRMSDVCEKFLNVSLDYKGSIPMDTALRRATKTQQLVVVSSPHSPSSLGIKSIVKQLNNVSDIEEIHGGMKFFWNHLFGVA